MRGNGRKLNLFTSAMLFAIGIAAMLLITGCRDKEREEQILDHTEENALYYIKQKYGFDAQIVNASVDMSSGLFGPSYNDAAYYVMEYDGDDFLVYIKIITVEDDGVAYQCSDDYQYDEIADAYKMCLDDVTGGNAETVFLKNQYRDLPDYSDSKYLCLFNAYFDGNNLNELSADEGFDCFAAYTDGTDLENLTQDNIPYFSNKQEFTFISYINKYEYNVSTALSTTDYVYKYAPYIDNASRCIRGDLQYIKTDVASAFDFNYMGENCSAEDVIIGTISPDDAVSWKGHGATENAQFVSGAYSIDAPDRTVWVYFPKNALYQDDYSNMRFATMSGYNDDGSKRFFASPLIYDVGDYLVTDFSPGEDDFYFVLISD